MRFAECNYRLIVNWLNYQRVLWCHRSREDDSIDCSPWSLRVVVSISWNLCGPFNWQIRISNEERRKSESCRQKIEDETAEQREIRFILYWAIKIDLQSIKITLAGLQLIYSFLIRWKWKFLDFLHQIKVEVWGTMIFRSSQLYCRNFFFNLAGFHWEKIACFSMRIYLPKYNKCNSCTITKNVSIKYHFSIFFFEDFSFLWRMGQIFFYD